MQKVYEPFVAPVLVLFLVLQRYLNKPRRPTASFGLTQSVPAGQDDEDSAMSTAMRRNDAGAFYGSPIHLTLPIIKPCM